jgi:hypothetical protein
MDCAGGGRQPETDSVAVSTLRQGFPQHKLGVQRIRTTVRALPVA